MKIETTKYRDNPLIFMDCTEETDGEYDFPCMFLVIGNIIMNIVFRNSYRIGTNAATINVTTAEGTTAPLISSFDLVVNDYVVTRRRYMSPGVQRTVAIKEARSLLMQIYDKLKESLVSEETDTTYTTLSVFPESGNQATVSNLKNNSGSFTNAVNNAINDIFK